MKFRSLIVSSFGVVILLIGLAGFWRAHRSALPISSASKVKSEPVLGDTAQAPRPSAIPSENAQRCAGCHPQAFAAWLGSQHAWANRLVDRDKDRPAFVPARQIQSDDRFFSSFEKDGKLQVRLGSNTYVPEAVIGIEPLRQYLIPFPGGRWQALTPAYDPGKGQWFEVFNGEYRQPQEWGHWTNRGLNWNSQCAVCHMTGLEKRYVAESDSYDTQWQAMGISCSQCHSGMEAHMKDPKAPLARPSKEQTISSCASCHSRRQELTGKFRAGDDYFDHYRPALADDPAVYYPDGQILDEDFEFGSFFTSRMHHKGVSCLDCHNPHTGKLLLPIENNALCMSCHAPPGRNQAIPIVASKHLFHPEGTPGGRCVDCHMAQNRYMQRDLRRDHGFICPDPLLTKELGIPNSCNRCHADKSVDWAIAQADQWYGEKMNRRSRARARIIARAQKHDPAVLPELIEMAQTEEVAGWKAVLGRLLQPWAEDPGAAKILERFRGDSNPMVRSTGVPAISSASELEKALGDSSRLVRLDAFQMALGSGVKNEAVRAEYVQFLEATHDQPPGAFLESDLALSEGRKLDAESWARKAAQWDPSAGSHEALGRVLHSVGKESEAEAEFLKAIQQEPKNAQIQFTLGLFYGETGDLSKAIGAFEATTSLDPQFGRGWYNLGLAYSGAKRDSEALAALEKAAAAMPESPEPSYAKATILARSGKIDQAQSALNESLKRSPNFAPAQELLKRISPQPIE